MERIHRKILLITLFLLPISSFAQPIFVSFDLTKKLDRPIHRATINWSKSFSDFVVQIDTTPSFSNSVNYLTSDTFIVTDTLVWWRKYYYQITGINPAMDTVKSPIYSFNLPQTINVSSQTQIKETRDFLKSYIFGYNFSPLNDYPILNKEKVKGLEFDFLDPFLKGVDEYTVSMAKGIKCHFYHLKPKISASKAAIIHQGHAASFFTSNLMELVLKFVYEGYDVFTFYMPFANHEIPELCDIYGSPIKFDSAATGANHENFSVLDSTFKPNEGNSLMFFVQPVINAVNFISDSLHIEDILMTGISGGGWETVVCSAIDERIKISFPIAGTTPLFLSSTNNGLGDYEQDKLAFTDSCNYLDMYILASNGRDRKQFQIFNSQDNCCFYGNGSELYKNEIERITKSIGEGEFNVQVINNKEHSIVKKTIEVIDSVLYYNKYFPINKSIVSDSLIMFKWQACDFKHDSIKYVLSVGHNDSLNNIVNNILLTDTFFCLYSPFFGDIIWKVKAVLNDSVVYNSPIVRFSYHLDRIKKNFALNMKFNNSIFDNSEYKHVFSANNVKFAEDRFGNCNSSVSFNGIDSYIKQIDYPEYIVDSLQNFSISFWCKTSFQENYSSIITNNRSEYPYEGFAIFVQPDPWGRLFFRVDYNMVVYSTNCNIFDNKWHHVVAMQKADTLKLYVDSKLNNQQVVRSPNLYEIPRFQLGANLDNVYSQNFLGFIDDLNIYKKALSESEIAELYNDRVVLNNNDTIKLQDSTLYLRKLNIFRFDSTNTIENYELVEAPGWINFDIQTLSLHGIVRFKSDTSLSIKLRLTTLFNDTIVYNSTLVLCRFGNSPVIVSAPNSFAVEDSLYSYQFKAIDSDTVIGDSVKYAFIKVPHWLEVDPLRGVISGIPHFSDLNDTLVIIKAYDLSGNTVKQEFSIRIKPRTNSAPRIISMPLLKTQLDSIYTYIVNAYDPKGDPVKYDFIRVPQWLKVDTLSGTLSGIPRITDLKDTVVIIKAYNLAGESTKQEFNIRIQHANRPPIIVNSEQKFVLKNINYNFYIKAEDPDSLVGDIVTYELVEKPDWLNINSSTGKLYGWPDSPNSFENVFSVRVTDLAENSDLKLFNIEYFSTLGISDLTLLVDAYPNPCQDYIYILRSSTSLNTLNVVVLNSVGVKQKEFVANELNEKKSQIRIDTRNLKCGVYFIFVTYKNKRKIESQVIRFVKI